MDNLMFIKQLNEWHDSDDHEKIIDAVEQLSLEERNFEITGLYARALINGTERYQEALDLLKSVEEQGKEDGVWNFRVGCCFYYLRRKPEAAQYFQLAIDYGDEWEETKEMLEKSLIEDPWDFLSEYIDKYIKVVNNNPAKRMTDYLNDSQMTLLAYNFLCGQVSNGGFIQLVQNGYSGFVFNSPFSKIIKEWGAEKTSGIVEKANIIYDKYQNELEKETSMEEFSELYKKITDFEPLENEFYGVMDEETKIIKKYVEENGNDFAMRECK